MKILVFVALLVACAYFFLNAQRAKSPPPSRPTHLSNDELSQACAVLGLNLDELDKANVISTHKRLMQHLHPDKGGSVALAQQLNEAKRVLLLHLAQKK